MIRFLPTLGSEDFTMVMISASSVVIGSGLLPSILLRFKCKPSGLISFAGCRLTEKLAGIRLIRLPSGGMDARALELFLLASAAKTGSSSQYPLGLP